MNSKSIINAQVARKASNDLNIATPCNVIGLAMVFEQETARGKHLRKGGGILFRVHGWQCVSTIYKIGTLLGKSLDYIFAVC